MVKTAKALLARHELCAEVISHQSLVLLAAPEGGRGSENFEHWYVVDVDFVPLNFYRLEWIFSSLTKLRTLPKRSKIFRYKFVSHDRDTQSISAFVAALLSKR